MTVGRFFMSPIWPSAFDNKTCAVVDEMLQEKTERTEKNAVSNLCRISLWAYSQGKLWSRCKPKRRGFCALNNWKWNTNLQMWTSYEKHQMLVQCLWESVQNLCVKSLYSKLNIMLLYMVLLSAVLSARRCWRVCGFCMWFSLGYPDGVWDTSSMDSWRQLMLRSALYPANLENVWLPALAWSKGWGMQKTLWLQFSVPPKWARSLFVSLPIPDSVVSIEKYSSAWLHVTYLPAGEAGEEIRKRTRFQFPFKYSQYCPKGSAVHVSSCLHVLLFVYVMCPLGC